MSYFNDAVSFNTCTSDAHRRASCQANVMFWTLDRALRVKCIPPVYVLHLTLKFFVSFAMDRVFEPNDDELQFVYKWPSSERRSCKGLRYAYVCMLCAEVRTD